VDLLCSTLKQVERSVELSPNDPALRELQHHILLIIAELEIEKSRAAYPEQPPGFGVASHSRCL
jgi:hypothetical protein